MVNEKLKAAKEFADAVRKNIDNNPKQAEVDFDKMSQFVSEICNTFYEHSESIPEDLKETEELVNEVNVMIKKKPGLFITKKKFEENKHNKMNAAILKVRSIQEF